MNSPRPLNKSEKLSIFAHGLELQVLKLDQSIGDIQENTAADKRREKRIIKFEASMEAIEQSVASAH